MTTNTLGYCGVLRQAAISQAVEIIQCDDVLI
jgi:hypothetical protein